MTGVLLSADVCRAAACAGRRQSHNDAEVALPSLLPYPLDARAHMQGRAAGHRGRRVLVVALGDVLPGAHRGRRLEVPLRPVLPQVVLREAHQVRPPPVLGTY